MVLMLKRKGVGDLFMPLQSGFLRIWLTVRNGARKFAHPHEFR